MRLDKPSPLIFLTQFKGCVRSVLGERAGLPRCSNLEWTQEGKGGQELGGGRTALRARASDPLIPSFYRTLTTQGLAAHCSQVATTSTPATGLPTETQAPALGALPRERGDSRLSLLSAQREGEPLRGLASTWGQSVS